MDSRDSSKGFEQQRNGRMKGCWGKLNLITKTGVIQWGEWFWSFQGRVQTLYKVTWSNCAPNIPPGLLLRATTQEGKARTIPSSSTLSYPHPFPAWACLDPSCCLSAYTNTNKCQSIAIETIASSFSWSALQLWGFLFWEAFHKYLKKVANASTKSTCVGMTGGVGGWKEGAISWYRVQWGNNSAVRPLEINYLLKPQCFPLIG